MAKTATPVAARSPISDEAIAALIAENQAKAAAKAPKPRRVTIAELFRENIELIASNIQGYRYAGLKTEANAVKVFELTLMWALNNRDSVRTQPDEPAYPDPDQGEGEDAVGPIPNEIIEPTPEPEA